jgi:hypothetical protein
MKGSRTVFRYAVTSFKNFKENFETAGPLRNFERRSAAKRNT